MWDFFTTSHIYGFACCHVCTYARIANQRFPRKTTRLIQETKSIQSDAWAQSNIENVTQKKQKSDFPCRSIGGLCWKIKKENAHCLYTLFSSFLKWQPPLRYTVTSGSLYLWLEFIVSHREEFRLSSMQVCISFGISGTKAIRLAFVIRVRRIFRTLKSKAFDIASAR